MARRSPGNRPRAQRRLASSILAGILSNFLSVLLEARAKLTHLRRVGQGQRSGVRVSLFLIALLPFLGALLPGLMNSAGRSACAGVTFTVTAVTLIGLLTNAPAVLAGNVVKVGIDWLPAIG